VRRSNVKELQYITGVRNLSSILELGILSHDEAAKIPHDDVSMPVVQAKRAKVRVPNGLRLHAYANVYFDARNPMMYYLTCNGHKDLVVLRVSSDILDLPGAVLTDGNAASLGTRFLAAPEGLGELDASRIYAVSWNHSDIFEKAERKRARCAEVLVPNHILPEYVFGCYTRNADMAAKCRESSAEWEVGINKHVYFQ
jgi:hypothetical protein